MTSQQSAGGTRLLSLPTPRYKCRADYECGNSQRGWEGGDAPPRVDGEVDLIISERIAPAVGASPRALHSTLSVRSHTSLVTSDTDPRAASRPQSRQRHDAEAAARQRRPHQWPSDDTENIITSAAASSSSSRQPRRPRRLAEPGGAGGSGASGDDRASSPGAESNSPTRHPQSSVAGANVLPTETSDSPIPTDRHDSAGSAALVARGHLQHLCDLGSAPHNPAVCHGDLAELLGEADSGALGVRGVAVEQLPLISATPYAESAPLLDNDERAEQPEEFGAAPSRLPWRGRLGFFFFVIVGIGILGAAATALVIFLPSDHNSHLVFKPTCNLTQALACSAKHGEWDNRCGALITGVTAARDHCCNSPAALNCYLQAFCAVDCPKLPGGESALVSLEQNWNSSLALSNAIASQMGLPPSEVTARTAPCDPAWCLDSPAQMTATVSFCLAVTCEASRAADDVQRFLWLSANASQPIRRELQMFSVPWISSGTISRSESLLLNSDFTHPVGGEWTVSGGSCVRVSSLEMCGNRSSNCVRCLNGSAPTMVQEVAVDAYPGSTQWALQGWFAMSKSSGHSAAPHVTLKWVDRHGGEVTPTGQADTSVTVYDPWVTGYLWPSFLPFVYVGRRPAEAVAARVTLGCKNRHSNNCEMYYARPVFAPAGPSCNETPNCLPTRCQGPFNETHDMCQTARACRGPAATPFDIGSDLTGILGGALWTGFVFSFVGGGTVGASISGQLAGGKTPPEYIAVYDRSSPDGNSTGALIDFACRNEPGTVPNCKNMRGFQPAHFLYQFRLAPNMSRIPSAVYSWRIVANTTAGKPGDSGLLCADVSWFVSPARKHVMDITVDPIHPGAGSS